MRKKPILACMAVAACSALIVAPSASAANLTENGVTIKAGASFTGTSNSVRFIAGTNTLTCTHARMIGIVTADSSGTIASEIGNVIIGGTGASTDCTSNGLGSVMPSVNSKLCLHIPNKTDNGTMTGCEGKVVTFSLNVTNLVTICRYEKAEIGVEITTSPADAQVKIRPGELAKGEAPNSIFCPAEFELEMEFTLTTTEGATLLFS